MKLNGLSTDSIELLEFLQSDFCREVFINNKLKIHSENGNVFFNNLDTNESIYLFSNRKKINQKLK